MTKVFCSPSARPSKQPESLFTDGRGVGGEDLSTDGHKATLSDRVAEELARDDKVIVVGLGPHRGGTSGVSPKFRGL